MAIVKRRRKDDNAVRFGVRASINGRRVWVGTFDTVEEAHEAQSKAKKDARVRNVRSPLTDEFAKLWVQQGCPRLNGRPIKSTTLMHYGYQSKPLIEQFRGVRMRAITREEAFAWAVQQTPSKVQFAAQLFQHALDLDLVDLNVFASLRAFQYSPGRREKDPLSEAEIHGLADTAGDMFGDYGPTFRAFLLWQGYTGMRPGETFAIRWGDLDFEEGRINVERRWGKDGRYDLPKNGKKRTIMLPPPAREAIRVLEPNRMQGPVPAGELAKYWDEPDLIFRGKRGQRLTQETCYYYWHRVRKAYGRPDVDLYELRHAAAHMLFVTKKIDARLVAVQLGHRDGGSLVQKLYGHGDYGALAELDQAWVGHVTPTPDAPRVTAITSKRKVA